MKKSTGNMYPFITHTWNPIRGKCPFNCGYCYAGRWKELSPLRLDEKVLNENLKENNFIFICSGCDLFHPAVPDEWISLVLLHTKKYKNNTYLLHTKNPERALLWEKNLSENYVLCVTIESDEIPANISRAPSTEKRLRAIANWSHRKMITVEPIVKMNPVQFAGLIRATGVEQVNVGAATGEKAKRPPEPKKADVKIFINYLQSFTKVYLKKNLRRLYPEGNYDNQ